MNDENRTRDEELAQAWEEISRLKRRLAGERFAEDLREALTLAAAQPALSPPR